MKRFLALMLIVVMLLPCLPVGAIAVEGEQQTEPVQVVYDFQLEQTDKVNNNGASFAGQALTGTANQGAIAGFYAEDALNWKYAADNNLDFKTETNQSFAMLYFGGSTNVWDGLRLGIKTEENGAATYPVGTWSALTIKVPTAGKYALNLEHQIRADGTTAGEIYFLEGTYADNAAIEAAMAAANPQKTVDFSKSDFTVEDAATSLGKKQLNAGEYTLVFKATAKKSAASACFFYLKKLTMTLEEEVDTDQLKNVSYNFLQSYVNETVGKSFANKYFTTIPNADIDEAYADEALNWKIAASNAAAMLADSDYAKMDTYLAYGNGSNWAGLRLAMRAEDSAGTGVYQTGHWYAFTLASPGEGNFDITLNYQTRSDANRDVKVYLLPGALTDPAAIQTAMNSATSLTTGFDARMDNASVPDNTSTTYNNASKSLGIQALTDTEYTLVIHAAGTNGVGFYLTGLTMAERLVIEDTTGDTTDTTGETTTAPEETTVPEETIPEEILPQGYNFVLSGSGLTVGGADFGGKVLDNAAVMAAVKAYYDEGMLDWKFDCLNNFASFAAEDSTLVNMYFIGGGNGYKWSGIRLGLKVEAESGNTFPAGVWTAMTLRSPGKGLYELTLDYQTRSDATQEGEIYLIKGTFTDPAAVEQQMTKDNLLKVLDTSSKTGDFADKSRVLGTLEMEEGEYTLVFKAAKSHKGGNYFYINELVFTETQPKPPKQPLQVNKLVYDFVLHNEKYVDEDGTLFGGRKLTENKVLAALDTYYEERILSWDYLMDNRASFQKSNNEVSDMYYIGGTNYKWAGLRLGLKVAGPELDKDGSLKPNYPEGWWTAMTLESPGKGTYYLSLDYQSRADGTPEGEIYLVKGTYTDAKALEKQLVSGNLLKTVSFNSRGFDMIDKQVDLGPVDLVQGEYTIVFKSLVPSKSAGAYMYLTKLTATHESIMPPPGPNEVIYDFDLQDRENGVYEKRIDLQEVWGDLDLNQRYASGKINWNYYTKDNTMADTGHCFASSYGMYMFALQDQWMAFKIKSPGNGLYTLTMNHARGGNGGTGAVYILPGNTKDIATAMDPSNRVGKITFANETGEPQVTDGFTTQLGTYNFKAGEEYIMVMEAYKNSPFKAKNSYMWISQLIALEGNHMQAQTANKKINSVVVDEAPVVQFGIGMYGAVSQVNGQDYFYFPTEGKQMFVYNLDDMVKVRKVTTPFTSSKGMCVDKDGMVWMVGDAQVLWRYDPYTNTGWTSANFKTTGGIENSSTALYCTAGSDGNIYFGSYTMGYVVRYNPKTDKFSKVTGGLINEDSSYSSGLIERDGYLYAAINGDRNADGKITAEYVKIDLKTDKIVDRVDITEQFGQTEVMVRGVGMCGKMLFAGGLSMKGFVAIDTETMELKDYGVANQIAIGTTEEIDGKIYFMLSGAGIRMYDSATDTITVPNKMESAVAGFRCGETNAVTLDHNPLFPGISYVTFGGTGIKIYNVESGNVYTPPLIDEENDGSGQVIRTIIRGPEGTNSLYIGGFNTDTSAVYDITQGKTVKLFETEGQTDVLMWYNDVLYAGNYPGAYVTRVNLDDPDRNVVMLSLSGGHYQQARIHALTAGDGMLFAGSIPDWYGYGGTFVATDLETLDRTMIEQMVQYQSITGLVYHDGFVYGTTSLSGGTAADEPYNDEVSAKIFVYDVKQKKKVAELDLREHIAGLADRLPYVDGITVDPNGQLWGVISETVFQFDYKPETGKFTVKEVLSFDKASMNAEGRSWKMCDFDYMDGYMYVALGNKGGLQKININNPSEHYRINCETPRNFVIGEDGNLYYALNTYEMKMYPLNITEEDWAVAEPVDQMILALKGKSSIADKEEILAAKNAYAALSWEHKALIQNYEILEIAVTDLLEAEIDTIGEVTLESEELIKRLQAEYEALPRKQQGYVKNYQTLNAADLALQDLINQREAARVQDLLNKGLADLGEITLEDETAIKALREAYDSLTFLQRQLVDASGLLDAEAKIKALRQVKIDRLAALIAQIGDPVSLKDEPVINEAMELYEWLYMDERSQVDYEKLVFANNTLKKLQKAAAKEVDALIDAIGIEITYDSGDAIAAARAAYDALTPGSKAFVTLLPYLEQAEQFYAELGTNPMVFVIIGAAAAVVILGVAVILILRKRKKASAKA